MAVLSVPSYVIPGTYVENIRFLEKNEAIDNIELLFFSFNEEAKSLLREELAGIRHYAGRFSYSVHMPDPLNEEHRTLPEMLRPIADRFVVHAPAQHTGEFVERIGRWQADYGEVFHIENVAGREFEKVVGILAGAPVCCDTGHLLLEERMPAEFINHYEQRIGEIHLHGISNGKDHYPLNGDERWFIEIAPFLERFAGIMHLEIFDYKKVEPMIDLTGRFRSADNLQEQY